MRVERFSLFFPPLLAQACAAARPSTRSASIPLGGYVKITGMSPHEELSPEVAPRAYLNQPPWKRIVVIAAGPAMNLLIAFLLGWAHRRLPRRADQRRRRATRSRARAPPPASCNPATRSSRSTASRATSRGSATPRPTRARSACRRVINRHAARDAEGGLPRRDAGQGGRRARRQAGHAARHAQVRPGGQADAHRLRLRRQRARRPGPRGRHHRPEPVAHHAPDDVLDRAHLLRPEGAQGRLRRRRLLRGHAPVLPVRHGPGAQHPGHHLALAGGGEPLPLPAPRRRPHLLGGGREDPRAPDPLPPDRAGLGRRLHAHRLPLRRRSDQRHRPAAREGFNVR